MGINTYFSLTKVLLFQFQTDTKSFLAFDTSHLKKAALQYEGSLFILIRLGI